MQNIKENIQLKYVRLQNVTIACHRFINIPMYQRGGKCIRSLFKEYQYALPENEGSIGFPTLHDIVKLLTFHSESKSGLSIYFMKFRLGKNVFDHIVDRIGQMDLNSSSSIEVIGSSKSVKKEWYNHY